MGGLHIPPGCCDVGLPALREAGLRSVAGMRAWQQSFLAWLGCKASQSTGTARRSRGEQQGPPEAHGHPLSRCPALRAHCAPRQRRLSVCASALASVQCQASLQRQAGAEQAKQAAKAASIAAGQCAQGSWVSAAEPLLPVLLGVKEWGTQIMGCVLAGISRDSLHKRRLTGGKQEKWRKKRK